MIKEKILIVEDNKALSKLIVKKMQASLDFDIVSAYSYEEARAIIEEDNDFFVALLDLNLPDAPNGEVVDMVIEHKIPVIVLTGSMDQKTRETILKKDVIDYVVKGGMDDVHYIFALIERLSKNRGIKLLVVDDSMVQRSQLKKLLKQQMYTVLVAAHGEEALVFLEDTPEIKLVLTDYTMPVINGLELSKIIRKTKSKNELPVIAMTGSNEALISAQFLKIGANDFVTKPFSKEELLCRIHNSLDTVEYIKKIEKMAQNDFLTGLLNYHYFREMMQAYFLEDKKTFAIALIDIDNFGSINDTHGEKVGDEVIIALAQILKLNARESDILAHFHGGKFCVALKDISHKNALEFFIKLCGNVSKSPLNLRHSLALPVTVSIGVALSEETSLDEMFSLAQSALKRAKENGKNKVEIA